jgi:LacI family transcriptional regulator
MAEVAQLADVALSTVSRALSGHPDVSRRMRAHIEAAAERLG